MPEKNIIKWYFSFLIVAYWFFVGKILVNLVFSLMLIPAAHSRFDFCGWELLLSTTVLRICHDSGKPKIGWAWCYQFVFNSELLLSFEKITRTADVKWKKERTGLVVDNYLQICCVLEQFSWFSLWMEPIQGSASVVIWWSYCNQVELSVGLFVTEIVKIEDYELHRLPQTLGKVQWMTAKGLVLCAQNKNRVALLTPTNTPDF